MTTLTVNGKKYSGLILISDRSKKLDSVSKSSLIYVNPQRTLVFKKIYRFLEYDVLEREIEWLNFFLNDEIQKMDLFPRLIEYDDHEKIIVMNYMGKPLNGRNCPPNYFDQVEKLVAYMHSFDCYHNDIKRNEILVGDDGKIRLCDFGMASKVNDFTLDGKYRSDLPPKFVIKDDLKAMKNGFKTIKKFH